jgi:PAS domain S-box-containing protein
MPNAPKQAQGLGSLRQRAAAKLSSSGLPRGKRASQIDALAVLYQLATSPTTAEDAIALLHELQVHQVELDLQQEELGRSHAELEAALSRQSILVERAPVGYMTIDSRTVLCEINLTGARLLGAAGHELLGRTLASFLEPRSVEALHALLDRTREGQTAETCELQLMPVAGMNRTVNAAAELDIVPERFLLVLLTPPVTQTG